MKLGLSVASVAAIGLVAAPAIGAPSGGDGEAMLEAGAARIDITPTPAELKRPMPVRDALFARAIFIRRATDCAILVGLDLPSIDNASADRVIEKLAKSAGCARDHIIVSATHVHSAGAAADTEQRQARIEAAIAEAVSRAKAESRPAKLSFGTTAVDLNTNRDLLSDGRWMVGTDPAGHSDKTLAVLALRDEANQPIAAYLNYAMHPVNYNRVPIVSADFAGEASAYIERRFGGNIVALFAQGASGDQNPRFLQPLNTLRGELWGLADMRATGLDAEEGGAIVARERQGTARFEREAPAEIAAGRSDAYAAALENVDELVRAEGAILGEAAIAAMRFSSSEPRSDPVIKGAHRLLQCPGRDRTDKADPVLMGELPAYVDGVPVTIRTGMLRIGDVHIAAVNGELYSEIAERMKAALPDRALMVTTLANGSANSGYIYSDDAASRLTFTVIGSRLKPGCADRAIVAAAAAMAGELSK